VIPLQSTTLLQKLTVPQTVTNSPHFMELGVACSPIQFFIDPFGYYPPFMPRSSNSLFPSHILTKTLCVFLFSPQILHVPDTLLLHLITLPILGQEATQYAVLFGFLKLPLSPRYLPQHSILKHPQPMFLHKHDQPCFTPIYNRNSIYRNDIPL